MSTDRQDATSSPPAYQVEGSGPLLVYVAGLDGTGRLFFKQVPRLSSCYRVATFRLREGGLFTLDDLTDDVAAIISDLGETRATIVGESFGGTVALLFACRYPKLVERLVVVNSFPRYRRRAWIKLAVWLTSHLPFRVATAGRFAASFLGLTLDRVSREDRRRFFAAIRTVKREGYIRRLELIRDVNIEEEIERIEALVLFLAGDRDLLVPSVREARMMAARMPNASVKVIRGVGHACLMGESVNLAEILAQASPKPSG